MHLWIDLDNSPHVLLFAPLVRELKSRGAEITITVREFSQTRELATGHGLQFRTVGEHPGSGMTVVKVASTFHRAAQLMRFARGARFDAAVSQGSRALVLAATAMRLPVMTLYDYEYASCRLFNALSDRVAVPDVIPVDRLVSQGLKRKKLVRYPGLKEEVYVYDFKPDLTILDSLGLDRSRVIVTVRPPAWWAHYSHEQSEVLFTTLMNRLKSERDTQVMMLARTAAQAEDLRSRYGMDRRFRIISHAVDGLSLMWCSDLVFSGGGTMIREAALLGVNAYTIFGGRMGAADELLVRDGKLTSLRDATDVAKVRFAKRSVALDVPRDRKMLANWIADAIVRFAEDSHRAVGSGTRLKLSDARCQQSSILNGGK